MAQVNIRVDDNLREEADRLFNELGLTFSAAVNVFLAQSVREQAIPFTLSIRNMYNKDTLQAIEDVKNKKNLSNTFSNISELMEDLNA